MTVPEKHDNTVAVRGENLSVLLDSFQAEQRRKRAVFAVAMTISILFLWYGGDNSQLLGYLCPLMLLIVVDLLAVSRSIRIVRIIERN